MPVQRQDDPESEIAALEDEVTACIDMLQGHFRTLLDAAYTARVVGEPPTDKWPDIDHALRAFAWESCAEVAESIAAYIDGEQEALLAALAPAEDEEERVVWDVPALSDAYRIEGYHHAGAKSDARVCVNHDREWVVYMTNNMTSTRGRGRGLLIRFAVAEALKTSPLDPAVQAVEASVLDAARELAQADAADTTLYRARPQRLRYGCACGAQSHVEGDPVAHVCPSCGTPAPAAHLPHEPVADPSG